MSDTAYHVPQGPKSLLAYSASDLGIPAGTALAASGTVAGNLVAMPAGFSCVAVSATASAAGNVVLNTYLDVAGTVLGEQVTVAVTAGGNSTAYSTPGRPFAAFKLSVTDTSATAGTCGANAGAALA